MIDRPGTSKVPPSTGAGVIISQTQTRRWPRGFCAQDTPFTITDPDHLRVGQVWVTDGGEESVVVMVTGGASIRRDLGSGTVLVLDNSMFGTIQPASSPYFRSRSLVGCEEIYRSRYLVTTSQRMGAYLQKHGGP